jgi:hypothetical protein
MALTGPVLAHLFYFDRQMLGEKLENSLGGLVRAEIYHIRRFSVDSCVYCKKIFWYSFFFLSKSSLPN